MSLSMQVDASGLDRLMDSLESRISAVQTEVTGKCKMYADTYTPMDSGNLKLNFEYTKNEKGDLNGWKYLAPYAHRQYIGIRKDGSPYVYSLTANDKAMARWAQYAVQTHRNEILAAAREALRR